MAKYIGVDIGGTKIAIAIGDEEGKIIDCDRFLTREHAKPERALEHVAQSAQRLLERHAIPQAEVVRIGISCGGPLDSKRGLVLSPPNLPGWDEIPICSILQRHLGVAARLENDANASALAEWMLGAGRGTRHMVFLTCSTGMGGGLIIDRRLHRGRRELAGEVGHVRLTDDGPVAYGKAGSFEGWSSGTGIAAQCGRSAEEVGRAALAGEAEALAVIRRAGEMLGRGIAILCDVLNPELVVCGTIAVKLGDLYLEPARQVVAREALDPCPIVPGTLGDELGNLAALSVAMAEPWP